MKRRLSILAMLAAPSCVIAHNEFRLNVAPLSPVPLTRSAQKRVAVVLRPSALKPRYDMTVGMLSYTFTNSRALFEDGLRPALRDKVAQLEFFGGEAEGGFDVYVYPKLEMDISTSLGSTCTVTVTFAVQGADGRLLAQPSHTATRSYALVAAAGDECNSALSEAVAAVVPVALAEIDNT